MSLHVRAVVLPDGDDRDIFIEDRRFVAAPSGDVRTLASGLVVLPGLVDAHAHLSLSGPGDPGPGSQERAAESARLHAAAGVLAVREPGSPLGPTVLPKSAPPFPTVVTGARFLAAPGRTHPGWSLEVSDSALPDAAAEAGRTAPWVKVIGDWAGGEGRWTPSFRGETLAEATRRSHAEGARVAVHAFLEQTIRDAVAAGVDSIEHGLLAGPADLSAMAEREIAFVPTLTIAPGLRGFARSVGADPADVTRIAEASAAHGRRVAAAAEAGVRVLAGTDGGVTRHGRVHDEVRRMVRAGVDPAVALGAAAWDARRFLGLPGIEPGARADLVAFDRDPREDPRALGQPALIVLAGTVLHPTHRRY